MIRNPGTEPPFLMPDCRINPEWEYWLKRNYPNLPEKATNANVFIRYLVTRAQLDIIIKGCWDDYSPETMLLLRESPELWELLQTINPPKPTWFQRFIRLFKRGK